MTHVLVTVVSGRDGNPLLNLISCFVQFLLGFDAPAEDPVGLRLLHLPQRRWCPPLLRL